MNQNIKKSGQTNMPARVTTGRTNTTDASMVVGIRTGNSWDFYYQHYYVGLAGGKIVSTGINLCVPI